MRSPGPRGVSATAWEPGADEPVHRNPAAPDDAVRALVEHIATHPDDDLSTAALAARAGVTPRRLTRLSTEQLGRAPGRYVRQARTEAAAHVLASTTLPMAGVAARCGLGSAETLRQAFTERFGIAPSRYRAAMRPVSGRGDQQDPGPVRTAPWPELPCRTSKVGALGISCPLRGMGSSWMGGPCFTCSPSSRIRRSCKTPPRQGDAGEEVNSRCRTSSTPSTFPTPPYTAGSVHRLRP
ncbi:helix-turn-helix domain-containing protein [Streptomyces sp. ID05-47C]|uniref:helix-turn-helix domain-containing protein n=1 Tax=Streptomyces sp. ID05-47C TaxID=3028665 RepID=UPI0029ABC1AC|nr:helix-turn-helix domain-containing protein [Streptomyces sp. ID05-47C]MDX3573396.1 helix-turn-helix domain-containing protein [Streptomyces sp. ID05-47C]